MGSILSWALNKPEQVPDTSWSAFLNSTAIVAVALILCFVTLILLAYAVSSRRKKIHVLYDLFGPYKPLLWMLLSIPAALLAGAYCFWQYAQLLDVSEGELGASVATAVLTLVVTAISSYALIVFVPVLTPRKFRYRPAPFLHRTRQTKT